MADWATGFEAVGRIERNKRRRYLRGESQLPEITKALLPCCSGLMVSIPEYMGDLANQRYQHPRRRVDHCKNGDQKVPEVVDYMQLFADEEPPPRRRVFDLLKVFHVRSSRHMDGWRSNVAAAYKWGSSNASSSNAHPSFFNHDSQPFRVNLSSRCDQSFKSCGQSSGFSDQDSVFCAQSSSFSGHLAAEHEVPFRIFADSPKTGTQQLSQQSDVFDPYPPPLLDPSSLEKPFFCEDFKFEHFTSNIR